jgi:hypothetical protein
MPSKKKAKTTDKLRKAPLQVKLMDITDEAW